MTALVPARKWDCGTLTSNPANVSRWRTIIHLDWCPSLLYGANGEGGVQDPLTCTEAHPVPGRGPTPQRLQHPPLIPLPPPPKHCASTPIDGAPSKCSSFGLSILNRTHVGVPHGPYQTHSEAWATGGMYSLVMQHEAGQTSGGPSWMNLRDSVIGSWPGSLLGSNARLGTYTC